MATEKKTPAADLKDEIEKIVTDIHKANNEAKKAPRGHVVSEVKELNYKDQKNLNHSTLLVYLAYNFFRDNKELNTKIVNEIIKKKEKNAFIIANRTIIHPKSKYTQKIPNNRTLMHAYESIFEDLIHPAAIVGKRIRYNSAGKKIIKYYLNEESRKFIESRIDLICHVYHQLTKRTISIDFKNEPFYAQIPLRKRQARPQQKTQRREKKDE